MAASSCTASRCAAPCTYCVSSTRLTTPRVMDRLSPPEGKPTTDTASCSSGTSPSGSGTTGAASQNSGSSHRSSARSASWPTAATEAVLLRELPWRSSVT